MTPEQIVEKQVIAYNERDIDAFVNCHSSKIELFNFPDNVPFLTGGNALRKRYGEIFTNSPNLHSEVVKRIAMGNTVIDYEIITGRNGQETSEFIAIYEITNERIAKARFIKK